MLLGTASQNAFISALGPPIRGVPVSIAEMELFPDEIVMLFPSNVKPEVVAIILLVNRAET